MIKKWTDKEKRQVVERCNSAKENGEKSTDILIEFGTSSSQLCEWRKKFNVKSKIPSEVFEEFKVKETSRQIIIDDYDHCCAVVVALVMSGYTVSQKVQNRKHFINYK